mmetsp:Transcript_13927/g.11902  ORF Transcript_13927/g.11902 Transcript_13927/m.11902 type:complete len:154 (-) Transcript_13927:202-663(-)
MDKAQKIMKHNYYELYPKERVVDAFLKVIENIKGHLEAIKDQDTNKILEEIDKTKIDDEIRREEFLSKNVRVKPTPSRMDRRSSESLSNSKASISRDDGDFDESGDEDNYNDEDAERDLEEERSRIINQVKEAERERRRKKAAEEKKKEQQEH